jgi:AcrR family transcriptional regulator
MQGGIMVKKTNIWVRVTQKVLQESLISLMKEKSVLNIAIKEICERAGVSRSTFYKYYHDQYDLLRQIEEEAFIETEKIIQPYLNGTRKSDGRLTTALLQDILQSIAGGNSSLAEQKWGQRFSKKVFP